MLLGIVETVFSRLKRPLPPRRNDLEFRGECLVGQFEPHLIVAFSGAPVGDGRRAFAQRHFDLMFGNHRAGQRRTEQVLVLVHSPGFQGREDVSGQEFLAQILDHNLACAGGICLLNHSFNVISLANIADHGNDVVRVIFLEPRDDDRRIESPGIGEDNFFRHERSLPAGEPRRPAANTKWPSEHACDSPPARR